MGSCPSVPFVLKWDFLFVFKHCEIGEIQRKWSRYEVCLQMPSFLITENKSTNIKITWWLLEKLAILKILRVEHSLGTTKNRVFCWIVWVIFWRDFKNCWNWCCVAFNCCADQFGNLKIVRKNIKIYVVILCVSGEIDNAIHRHLAFIALLLCYLGQLVSVW